MSQIAIAVHGGAGPDSGFIKNNLQDYKQAIERAIQTGYNALEIGKTSVDAVEAAIKVMEDDPLFNAGRGSALNELGEVEMCASIMTGKDGQAGAVALVKKIKNPVSIARLVMEKTKLVLVGGDSVTQLAEQHHFELMPAEYFITGHQYQEYLSAKQNKKESGHGTVGAVALDRNGNIAAATSTGGLENSRKGRIADSSVIGAGTYANNETCAVSCTGDGEYMMRYVLAYQVAALMEFKNMSVADACAYLFMEKYRKVKGDMGMIAIDKKGNIAVQFNSHRMHRGWRKEGETLVTEIY